jgi:hypothetical protein
MRFRPIGFGNGKTGTIGSSSSSDASSSTDTDADEEMEDALPVLPRPLDLDHANTRLSEHVSKASESQDDTSSSGEEMDDPPTAAAKNVALADSPSESDSTSETSHDDMEDVPKITSALKKSSNSAQRPLKRKLNDFKKDYKTSNTLYEQFKANGTPLKTANIKKLAPESASKVNGNATTSNKNIISASPSKRKQVLPPLASGPPSSPANGSKPKATPVPPPRQSSILPPHRGNKSSDVHRVTKAAGASPEASPVKVTSTRLPSEKNSRKSLKDRIQSIDPALSEKEREKEIRRLRKEASRMPKNQRRESMNSATSDTLDRSIKASSPSRNAQQHPSQARSPPKLSTNKDLSKDAKPSLTTSVQKVSKKPKKHPSNSVTHNENGETAISSHETSTTIPSLRKESVILPPKFIGSVSR